METIKSFTSLEQSKKLAEFLSLESADMHYHYDFDFDELESIPVITEEDDHFVLFPEDVRCWSLAALLNVIPYKLKIILAINDFKGEGKEKYATGSVEHNNYDCYSDNPVDACYKLILKLNELNLL